jgi:two-component system LytT family response regulator
MFRCIIVDDESGAIEILSRYVHKTPELKLVRSFRDSIEALTFLAGDEVDLVFLDIDMPNLDGMQLAELVRNRNIQVIFCTAYSEYAVRSYEKEAVDYLLKPIAYERFLKAVKKALKAHSKGGMPDPAGIRIPGKNDRCSKLFIKSGPRLHQLDIGDLLFMEKKEHYVIFHTPGEQILSRMNMNDLMKTLPPDNFIRIHRSFVVAIDKIDTIETQMVVIRGRKIPIGENYREDFFKRIPYSGN